MELRHIAASSGTLHEILKQELRLSTGLIGRLKFQSALLVNGAPQRTNYPVKPGDEIRVRLLEPEPGYPAEAGELHILYEDEHILAVDKPMGLIVHPTTARMTGTLANRLLAHYRAQGSDAAVHPLTRLDRDTFGVVLLAKHSHAHALLSEQQRAGGFEKIYHALVLGTPEAQRITAPILRPDPMKMLRVADPSGKPAETLLTPLKTDGTVTLTQLRPLTGRTHQLRVHCLSIGCPILGDPQYFTSASQQWSQTQGLVGQQLGAMRLAFSHPMTGEALELRSGFCLDLQKYVAPDSKPVYNKDD